MKKVLLLAIASFLAAVAPALAHPPAANVNFSSERGVPFGLVLDGRPLTRGAARQVHVDQLAPGQHWADFSLPTAYGGVVRFRSRVWLEPGLETSFVLIARPGWPLDLRQVNAVPLYGPYDGRGYGNGRSYGYHDNGGGRYNGPSSYGQNQGNGYPSGGYGSGYGSNAPLNGDDYDGDDQDNANGPNGAGAYPGTAVSTYRTLAPPDVEALLQDLRQQPGDAAKLSAAERALDRNSIRSEDLGRLLQGLDNDAARMTLANYAYPHVADPQNFDRVYAAFNSDGAARSVQQSVATRHARQD